MTSSNSPPLFRYAPSKHITKLRLTRTCGFSLYVGKLVTYDCATMNEEIFQIPTAIEAIRQETEKLGFTMASEPKTGSLLRAMAAAKPGGRLLELGTGTGIGTAWLLSGM